MFDEASLLIVYCSRLRDTVVMYLLLDCSMFSSVNQRLGVPKESTLRKSYDNAD
jgi:hypothetical protein